MTRLTDSHLQPSWLLRNMPRMLVMTSFATMALLWVAVTWRLDQAREASLDAGQRTARMVSVAFDGAVQARALRAEQAAFTARKLAGASPDSRSLRGAVEERLGLVEEGTVVLVASPTGRVIMASDTSLEGTQLDKAWRERLVQPTQDATVLPMAAAGSNRFLGFASSIFAEQQAAVLVVALSEESLKKQAAAAMGDTSGRLTIVDPQRKETLFTYLTGSAPGDLSETALFDYQTEGDQTRLLTRVSVPQAWALQYHYKNAVPSTVAISVILGLLSWAVFITAAIGFKRALLAQRKLTKLVALDALTGLPNRRTFTSLLAQGLARSQRTKVPYGLLFIDLDNFKYVNDTHGHDAGDVLLKEVAKRLSGAVRTSDYVCRLGGDEFVVLLSALERPRDAEEVARRILEALALPIRLGEADLHMGASLGIAMAPRDAQTATQLVVCADMAVYRAKAEGKGCFAFFDPSLKAKAEARSRISQDIRQGIQRNEFYLVYQPKMDLHGRKTTGFEALMRWKHPQIGQVQPGEFIPVAEETGLIEELGDVALKLAIGQVREWHEAGRGWQTVAVNVSARQLREAKLSRRIESLLVEHRVPGACLQVELTESMLALDEAAAARVIKELKRLGVKVSVDDFGTGYSSLSALQRYDVDYLKIDRSFVKNIETDSDSLEICRAIVQMAHALKVRTIAEGIETPGQYAALLQLGCDEGQGFFMARPMEHDDAIAWTRPVSDFADSSYDIQL